MNESGAQERPVHGGLNISELDSLGLCQDEIIDFSASVNPLGPSLRAVDAARNADLGAYPDTDCIRLRNAIGEHSGTDPGNLLVGNSSTELIHLLARAYLKGEASVLVFSPTFGEYEAACRLQGVAPVVLSPSNTGFHWDVQAASIAALSDIEHVEKGREAVQAGKQFLSDALISLGIECMPSAANFLLIHVGQASELRLALLKRHKICVRDCTSFGLPEYIRVGIRSMNDNHKLVEALRQVLQT